MQIVLEPPIWEREITITISISSRSSRTGEYLNILIAQLKPFPQARAVNQCDSDGVAESEKAARSSKRSLIVQLKQSKQLFIVIFDKQYFFPNEEKIDYRESVWLVSTKDRIWEYAKRARWNIDPVHLLFPCEKTNKQTNARPKFLGLPPFKLLNESKSPGVPFFLYYRMHTLYSSECWRITLYCTDGLKKGQTPSMLSGSQKPA